MHLITGQCKIRALLPSVCVHKEFFLGNEVSNAHIQIQQETVIKYKKYKSIKTQLGLVIINIFIDYGAVFID